MKRKGGEKKEGRNGMEGEVRGKVTDGRGER